jgi:hypothetical protein
LRTIITLLALSVTAMPAVVFAGKGGHFGGHSPSNNSNSHPRSYGSSPQLSSHSSTGSHLSSSAPSAHTAQTPAFINSAAPKSSRQSSAAPSVATNRGPARAQDVTRDSHGKIARSEKSKDDFRRSHPCPATGQSSGACPGYVVDHITPLKRGGPDAPSNMQWQTVAAAKAKDRWE